MLAPLNSDAPLYHWPAATAGLIAVNVLAFLLITSGALGDEQEVLRNYGLVLGAGLHPLQWVTSNFVHVRLLHLAGNMLFLWPFGLVVEGKVGWRRFLGMYLLIGAVECALEQICLLALPGVAVAFGASGIVFGLMAVALVWAPRNDLIVGYWLPIMRVGTFETSILSFSVLMAVVQGGLAWWAGFGLTGQFSHFLGAAIGVGVGVTMLRRGSVDCEHWDLLSVLRGRHRKSDADMYILSRTVEAATVPEMPPATRSGNHKRRSDFPRAATRRKARCITRVRALLDAGRSRDALKELDATRQVLPEWRLPPHDQLRLADALHDSRQWDDAVALWEEYLHAHPEAAAPLRLQSAAVMLQRQCRPQAALALLDEIDEATLSPAQRSQRDRLMRHARRMLAEGVIELGTRAD